MTKKNPKKMDVKLWNGLSKIKIEKEFFNCKTCNSVLKREYVVCSFCKMKIIKNENFGSFCFKTKKFLCFVCSGDKKNCFAKKKYYD